VSGLPAVPCGRAFDHVVHIHKTPDVGWARCHGDPAPADMQAAVRGFHLRFGFHVADVPLTPPGNIRVERARIFASEAAELVAELLAGLDDGPRIWETLVAEFETRSRPDPTAAPDLVRVAHETGDVVCAATGVAVNYGFPLAEVFSAVHAANLTRVDEQGRPLVRGGKAVKGPRYEPPDIAGVLARAALAAGERNEPEEGIDG